MEFLRTLVDTLKLAVMVRPRRPARRIGPGQFWLASALVAAIAMVESALAVGAPRAFDPGGFSGIAFYALFALLASYVAARALDRPASFWPLATLLLLLEALLAQGARGLAALLADAFPGFVDGTPTYWIWVAWLLLAARRTLDYLEPHRSWRVRGTTALLLTAALVAPPWWIYRGDFFYPAYVDDVDPGAAVAAPAFDAETVLTEQPQRVDDALARLAPQRPGVVDLYFVAFGSYGAEDVFRNEVLYAERLFEQRFGARERTLVLLNHADTVAQRPLATLSNLRRALDGIGARIDRDEDIVVLFVTTHGSEEHELAVELEPLPLNQVTPALLAEAIAHSGIRWRVIVVSACYSGGYLPALSAPEALVVTAARADRTSFGCGTESDLTYFGRAFLVEGLNETGSLTDAFAIARERIARREKDEGKLASEPQIAAGDRFAPRMQRWLESVELGEPIPFAVPEAAPAAAHAGERDAVAQDAPGG